MRCDIILRDLERKGLHEAAKLVSDLMVLISRNVEEKKCANDDLELFRECHDVIGEGLNKIRERRIKKGV